MNGREWTERELALLRELYPHKPTGEVARQMGRSVCAIYGVADKLGLRKSAEYLASPAACRLRRGDNIGAPHRFQKGHVPANKGLRRPGYGPGRMKETQFKKGMMPPNKRELGDLRMNADGYIDMKIGEGKGAHAWRASQAQIMAQAIDEAHPASERRAGEAASCQEREADAEPGVQGCESGSDGKSGRSMRVHDSQLHERVSLL